MFLSLSDIIKLTIVIICILSPYMFAVDGVDTPNLGRRLASRTRRRRGGNLINIYFLIYYKLQEYGSPKN